jgi:capsular polysaccharide transport system permease protein
LIGRLGTDLAETQSRASELEKSSPNDPGLTELRGRASALQQQIDAERNKITRESSGLADKLSDYERLTLDREYAKASLDRALNALDSARAEARRQQLFLERIVNPNLPDAATMPRRIWTFCTMLALNLVGLMVVWLMTTGLREHSSFSD